jgi:hypothetical protein
MPIQEPIEIEITGVNNNTRGPLSPLEIGGSGVRQHFYPQEFSGKNTAKNQKSHSVQFVIKDINTTGSFENEENNNTNIVELPTTANFINQVGEKLSSETIKSIGISLKSGLRLAPKTDKVVAYITLYMPDTLNATYNATYDEMSLTSDLGSLVTTLRSIDSAVGNIKGGDFSSIQSSLSSLGNSIGKDPNALQAIVSGLDVLGQGIPGVDSQNLATLLQKAQGFALNPQLQMIYRGTALRTFQLVFNFTPKNSGESQQINDIIDCFRFFSAPSLSNSNVSSNNNQNMFLIPPSIFELSFNINGTESRYLPKYGDCILASVDVNHSPNGLAVFTDGSMVQTQLTLSFKELDILTRDKISKSFKDVKDGAR